MINGFNHTQRLYQFPGATGVLQKWLFLILHYKPNPLLSSKHLKI